MKKFLMMIPMMCLCALSFGAEKIGTDTGYLGNDQWAVRADGDIIALGDYNIGLNGVNFAADGEASDTYAITLAPVPSAYVTGMMISFTATTANTGACTVNVNGLGAKALLSLNDVVPPDNYIEAGSVVVAVYDGTSFQMIQPDANPA